ncbi:hypothetical protein CS954_14750 [Bacillus siamensis]|nr:hypothetical protein CS954_14750 [Bacillus siamensis]
MLKVFIIFLLISQDYMKFFRSYTIMSHFITQFIMFFPVCLSDIPFELNRLFIQTYAYTVLIS